MANPAGHLGRDDRGAGAAERLVDRLAGRRVVLDRPLHALDRLLGAVAGLGFGVRDLPDRRLLAVAGPMAGLALADRVPGRLMLPVIIAAADHQPGLVPDDLRADDEAGSFETRCDRAGVQRAVPDIGDIAGKERPGLAPVGAVVVEHLSAGQRAPIRKSRAFAPAWIVVHAIGRIGHHQVRYDSRQRAAHCGCIGAVATHEPVRVRGARRRHPTDRVDRSFGDVIGIRQALDVVRLKTRSAPGPRTRPARGRSPTSVRSATSSIRICLSHPAFSASLLSAST